MPGTGSGAPLIIDMIADFRCKRTNAESSSSVQNHRCRGMIFGRPLVTEDDGRGEKTTKSKRKLA